MGKKLFTWLSWIALFAGGLLAVYVLLDIYLFSRNTPPGSCPVVSNRPIIYAAVILCAASFIFSLFEKRSVKK